MRLLPAYPLFVKDPYFSIWSQNDVLNENDTVFWTGAAKKTYGIINVDGKSYCFLGDLKNVEKLKQIKIEVKTFRTIYHFESNDFNLEVVFFSPLPATDYEVLSCPVCYAEYTLIPKKELKDVKISISLHETWCYNGLDNKEIRGDVFASAYGDVAYFGLNRQHVFNKTADRHGADWGYYYILAEKCYFHAIDDFNNLSAYDNGCDITKTKYITGQNSYDCIQEKINGKILIAFDDVASVQYFGQILRGYFFKDGKNILDALVYSVKEYQTICGICQEIENKLKLDCEKFGDKYVLLLNAAYRQVMAAHKLVVDLKGRLLFLSKECGSCGLTATVDVTYPTMPMLALYNPQLIKASLEPIFDFSQMDVWEYDFAPHDAGMYPFCNGQYYGVMNKKEGRYGRTMECHHGLYAGKDVLPQFYLYPSGNGIYAYEKQMPIEECGNMLICCTVYAFCGGDKNWLIEKLPILRGWCEYLVNKGLIPENQLCTDDFLSHMDKNVNLAIKSVVAIAAFAKLLELIGENGERYKEISKQRANEMMARFENRCMPLSFDDSQASFSMKYNLVPAILLDLKLFSKNVIEQEVDVCLMNAFKFGFPLDHRSKMTKTDWMMWIAALTDDKEKQEKIIGCLYNILTKSPDRVPFPDWLMDCEVGTYREFANRTVQGSMFILLLKEKLLKNC